MTTFTREQLESKTAKDLKNMCVYELNIPGMTKKPKDIVVDAILAKYGAPAEKAAVKEVAKPAMASMAGVEFTAQSVMTKPGESFGRKTTTTIHVSCGANSGNFPVAGRTVKEVGEFLREVLNLDSLSTGLVNGNQAEAGYVLQPGDNLEFLKPAGRKGC